MAALVHDHCDVRTQSDEELVYLALWCPPGCVCCRRCSSPLSNLLRSTQCASSQVPRQRVRVLTGRVDSTARVHVGLQRRTRRGGRDRLRGVEWHWGGAATLRGVTGATGRSATCTAGALGTRAGPSLGGRWAARGAPFELARSGAGWGWDWAFQERWRRKSGAVQWEGGGEEARWLSASFHLQKNKRLISSEGPGFD